MTTDRLQWWREARFGMFIHWGLYAVPAGIWKGQEMPGIGEWLMAHFKVPLAEYRQLAPQFNPVQFDAEQVVALAKEAGMKYLVITAKHHDGFAMWDSQVSAYNIVKATPYRRDPMKDLARACAKHGIRFCFYYSQDLDWEHPDGGGNHWDYDPAQKDFSRYLEQKVKSQLRELLTGYGPIGLIWCDTPVNITADQSRDLKKFIQSLQPDCLVSGRVGHGVGDYECLGDNTFPVGRLAGNWETPATMNRTWGYKVNDQHWKPTATLLATLVDCASKGVNYLLNIGPTATGEIPRPSIDRLREIGAWFRVNGEAIYGTQASPFPYEFDWGRITQKPGKLYLFFHESAGKKITVAGLVTRVQHARSLATGQPLAFQQDETLELQFTDPPGPVELQFAGEVVAEQSPLQQPSGNITLPAHMAELHVHAATVTEHSAIQTEAAQRAEHASDPTLSQFGLTPNGLTKNWSAPADWLSWEFHVSDPGAFVLTIHTVAPKYQPWQGGHRVQVRLDSQQLGGMITADETIHSARTEHFAEASTRLDMVHLATPGLHRLELHLRELNAVVPGGLCVSEVRLQKI